MKHLEIVNSKAKNPSTGSFDNGLWGGIGIDGKSVVSGEIAANGHLIFTLSDNSQIDCGVVDNLFGFDDVPTLGSHNLVDSGHIKLALNQKVDVIAGKGLPTEDYTTADQAKVAALGAAAVKGVDSSPTAYSTNLVESGGVEAALAGKQDTLTTAQQAAADSGITATDVQQISTNENNILTLDGKLTAHTAGGANYDTINGIRVYVSSTAPTGDIPTGSIWIGG